MKVKNKRLPKYCPSDKNGIVPPEKTKLGRAMLRNAVHSSILYAWIKSLSKANYATH
jgi:hypothetical protein